MSHTAELGRYQLVAGLTLRQTLAGTPKAEMVLWEVVNERASEPMFAGVQVFEEQAEALLLALGYHITRRQVGMTGIETIQATKRTKGPGD